MELYTAPYKISFDCGTKRLGIGVYRLEYADELVESVSLKNITNEFIKVSHKKLDFQVFDFQVVDIRGSKLKGLPGKLEMLRGLNTALKSLTLPPDSTTDNTAVYVEFQMGANQKTRTIQDALCMYFIEYPISIVMPALKNRIGFRSKLMQSVFMESYTSPYTANKKHTEANMKYLFIKKGIDVDLDFGAQSFDKLDDVADTLMQVIGKDFSCMQVCKRAST